MKKIILILFILVVAGGFWAAEKYSARQKRLESYKVVQNTKAAEVKITFIEGWTNKEIANYLESKKITTAKEFLDFQKKFDYSSYADISSKPKNVDLEGYIFPDTYIIPETAPSGTPITEIILKKALNNFENKITPEILAGAKKHGLTFNEFITLASIVEGESGGSMEEKKLIAGVFYNRLKIGMPLQSDATVSYITGKNNPQSTIAETQIDSPYNTYKYAGLPPGPVNNPGVNAIKATAEPTDSDYLYFLHDQKTGKAYFGRTLEEHNENRRKYLK